MERRAFASRSRHARAAPFLARLIRVLAVLFLVSWAGVAMAAGWVGDSLGDVKPEDQAVSQHPMPVQLSFQFQTKGAPNDLGTRITKQLVIDAVKASGLFSDVTEEPVPSGASLSIVINNTLDPAEMDKAQETGGTLFVVRNNIRDYYVATLDFVSAKGAARIRRSALHSIVTPMGLIGGGNPEHAIKVPGGGKGALATMVRQIVSNPLNEIARDRGFAGAGAATPPSPHEEPAPAPAAPAPAGQPTEQRP